MKKSQINILIVDDEESIRKSLSEAVRKFGYRPTVASRSDEAINFARIKPIHLAIIDCMLPKKNGVELSQELRTTRFGDAPIILMSGIFRDKSFAIDSMRKTGAKEFIYKPIDIPELKKHLTDQLASLIDEPKIPLHTLLSKPYASNRDRRKALENVDEINGFDLPFVLSILMDADTSGHLNIVNTSGELFGIDISEGSIVKVDSSESEATLSLLLMRKGFITAKDLEEFNKDAKRGDLVKNLIEENLISPHALPIIKAEQIMADLKRLFVNEPMQINFVPADVKDAGIRVDMAKMLPLLHEATEAKEGDDFILGFYKPWWDYPIRLGPQFKKDHEVTQLALVKKVEGLMSEVEKERTIREIRDAKGYSDVDLLKGLHMLALLRMIIFDDVKRDANSQQEHFERMTSIEKELTGKNPFEVFQFFGAGEKPKAKDVERIYKEFAKSNHPDLLPPNASDELKKTVNSVFSIVSEAADVLLDESKREKLNEEMQHAEARRQMEAEQIAEDALINLRRGKAQAAEKALRKAYGLYKSRTVLLYWIWAQLKAKQSLPESARVEIYDHLESFPVEERRNAIYQMVYGLFKWAQGDLPGAKNQFEKALHFDPHFLDARRELSALLGTKKKKKGNVLSADLGSLVGNLFKKKS